MPRFLKRGTQRIKRESAIETFFYPFIHQVLDPVARVVSADVTNKHSRTRFRRHPSG